MGTERAQPDYVRPIYCSNYRPPEIILGKKFGMPTDIWNAAVTLFEFATNRRLFTERTNNAILFRMLKICGEFSRQVVAGGKHTSKHFVDNGSFRLKQLVDDEEAVPNEQNEAILPMERFPRPKQPVLDILEAAIGQQLRREKGGSADQGAILRLFAELLASCLFPNPASRVDPATALKHQFFRVTWGSR